MAFSWLFTVQGPRI